MTENMYDYKGMSNEQIIMRTLYVLLGHIDRGEHDLTEIKDQLFERSIVGESQQEKE